MAKRNVPRASFPHLKTGSSQYPEKPAGVHQCLFCGRKGKRHSPLVDVRAVMRGPDGKLHQNGPIVQSFQFCAEHDNPTYHKMAHLRKKRGRLTVNHTRRRPAQ